MKSLISLKNYKYPKDKLTVNAEILNNTKRDMRKKVIKSNTKYSDLKRPISKKQTGGLLNYNILNIPFKDDVLKIPELNSSLNGFYFPTQPIIYNSYTQPEIKITSKKDKEKDKIEIKEEPKQSNPFDNTYGYMKVIIDSALNEGVPLQVTSGYRPGSKTSNGSESWHSKGHAIDIIPAKGISWEEFKNKLYNATNTLKLMKKLGYGILDETTPEMLAKTGGTGTHLHIGKDKLALENFYKLFPHLKKGGLIPKAQEGKKFKLTQYWGTPMVDYYVVKPGDNFNTIQNKLETDSLQQYNNIKDTNKIYAGDTLYYRNEPSFFDNFYRFWMESPKLSQKNISLNEQIEKNIQKSGNKRIQSTITKKIDPIQLAIDFMTGTGEHDGWEGFKDKIYWDEVGKKYTIGYGLTDPELLKKYKNGITRDQARKEMKNHITDTVIPHLTSFKWWDKLDSNLQAALIDAHYNIGYGNFMKSKKLLNLLENNASLKEIIAEMDWNKNTKNGLGDRSGARRALAAGKYDINYIPYSGKYVGWIY